MVTLHRRWPLQYADWVSSDEKDEEVGLCRHQRCGFLYNVTYWLVVINENEHLLSGRDIDSGREGY